MYSSPFTFVSIICSKSARSLSLNAEAPAAKPALLINKSIGRRCAGIEFIAAMQKLRATHVFLIFSESYPLDKRQFEAAGLNEQEDFLDGKLLLPQREGGYVLDSYQAFRSM